MSCRLILALCLLLCHLGAQTGAVNGSIRGFVQDPTGSSVPNASVTARNLATGYQRVASTGQAGQYELPLLPVGQYEVTAQAAGFERFLQSPVTVELGKASAVDIALRIGTDQQTVTVESDASILTTNSFAVQGGLNERSIENAPIASRNTFNLALLAPGFNGRRDDEFGNPSFAFGGMQRRAFLVDGIDNTQRGGPGRLGIFSPEAIREVRVIQNAMAAEYGRTVGGIISMVTRSGSNELHGEALVLQRRPGLIARPSLAATKPFQQWATYSGMVSGPIKQDKVFFLATGEYEPLNAPRPITISAANAQALQLPASELGSAPFAQRFQTYLGRVDFQFSPENSVYIRYSNFWTPSQFNTSGGLSPRSAANNFDDRNDTLASQWTSILGPNTVNELRFGGLQREFTRPPVSGVVGAVTQISGVANLGSNDSAGQYYKEQQFNWIDSLSYRRGQHSLKAGVDVATIRVQQQDRLALNFQFGNLAQYLNTLAGTASYTQLTQDFGNNSVDHRTGSYNFFAQDDWQIVPRLTLSYGLRYELLTYPALPQDAPLPESRQVASDTNNWAPRLGFAWQPSSRTVVRGGYGLFYDTTNLRLLSLAIRQNGIRVLRYVIRPTDSGAPAYPAALASPGGTAQRPSITNFAGDFRSLYAHQANLQMEQAITNGFSVTVGTQWYGGRRLPLAIDTNLGAPAAFLADGRPTFVGGTRPNSAFNQVLQLRSVGNSTYYGGFVSAQQRCARGLQWGASYTIGWAFNVNDATGDTAVSVSDSTSIRRDYGLSSSDQRHRFVLQGVWTPTIGGTSSLTRLVNGWMISPNVTLTSSFPVNVVQGTDLNGDGVNNDRPLFRGRNDTAGYGFREVNLRVSRTFSFTERLRLEVIAEAENLLNSTNAACSTGGCSGAVVSTFAAADFRRVTSATNSRQIQLGGRFRF